MWDDGERRCGGTGDDIPFAPPVIQLHSKVPLRSTSPFRSTTYTRTRGFCPEANPEFQRMARQNPPVLWLTESACSCPEQPLSATHGRQRYNTLDFSSKVVCHETAGFIGFFPPRRALPSIGFLPPRQRRRLWKPLPRGAGRQWRPQSVCDTLKHRPSRQARPLSPLDSPANRVLPAPIG